MATTTAVPALRRDPENGVVAGVCTGVARRFGVDVLWIRVAVALLTVTTGIGLLVYAAGWILLPVEGVAEEERRPRSGGVLVGAGAACLTLSVLLAAREAGAWAGDTVVWPIVLTITGAAVVWHQSVGRAVLARRQERPRDAPEVMEAPTARERALTVSWTGVGVAMIVGAGILVLLFTGALDGARDSILTAVVLLGALLIVATPFAVRFARTLAAERGARIRSQERAEVAAHLHDSVLQTLALVQKQAADPKAVAALARRQERELRTWLAGGADARPDERLADALRAAAVEVEDAHGVAVELVAVGDRPLEPRGVALVAAAREAMVNAARHAGDAGPVSVFAEIDGERAEVFVRDRGPGFEPDAVPPDRRGVRESIVGRMARHGGRATIHTAPGEGTEVELAI